MTVAILVGRPTPDLQRLLDDIRARKIDVIVVYKVDRLTRSLADFAKLHSSSSLTLLQHPAPVPFVIAVDCRVWLARAPACPPFVQRDDALASGMRRIDAAIRRDMRDRLDSRGNLHLRPQDRLRGRNSDFRMPALLPASIARWMRTAASETST